MTDTTQRKVSNVADAIQRILLRLQYVEDSKLLYLMVTTAQSTADPGSYNMQSQTLVADELSQQELAMIQTSVQRQLWANARTHVGTVPWWSQPPRPLRSFRWHDLVLLGFVLGMALSTLVIFAVR